MGFSIKASNISYKASERDIYEFFSFSGEITGIETKTDLKKGQIAYVTFAEERALETALLLSGAVIVDEPIIVEVAEGYELPDRAAHVAQEVHRVMTQSPNKNPLGFTPDLKTAEETMASMLASGYILSKDAVAKAKDFDEQHSLSRSAAAQAALLRQRTMETAAELDRKYDLTKKFSETSASVAKSWASVDETYKVSEKAKGAAVVAQASIAEASQYVMQNQYVQSGASWLTGAFGKLGEIVGEVKQQTMAKVHKAEEERGDIPSGGGGGSGGSGYTPVVGLDEDPADAPAGSAGTAGPGSAAPTSTSLDHGPPLFSTSEANASRTQAPSPAAPAPAPSLMDDVFSSAPAVGAPKPAKEELPLF
eukprot:TRINITY_DN14593_c0_g1_i4.p1 TRINITY_DN14593_c0_g1~~TRINITY_DN14593_c0_g1_i4.p1  ORF type:complete len:365 (+),score=63.76 TRINITY_DN14593_c0_g1_i4:213-1307(+)